MFVYLSKNILFTYVINREILRDCHLLLNLVLSNGCYNNCPIMNASEDIEYLCSCHPRTNKVKLRVFLDF